MNLIEKCNKFYVYIRPIQNNNIKCQNPYILELEEPLYNIISVSIDTVNMNLSGPFNTDYSSVIIYIPEFQSDYALYDSSYGKSNIFPFAFIPVTEQFKAQWYGSPFIKKFETPIPKLTRFTIMFLNLDQTIDTRIISSEIGITFTKLESHHKMVREPRFP